METTIMENQMEKKMEHEMETGISYEARNNFLHHTVQVNDHLCPWKRSDFDIPSHAPVGFGVLKLAPQTLNRKTAT